MSYNIRYNWIREQLNRLDRKKARIIIHAHALEKAAHERFTIEQLRETVQTGRLVEKKCGYPNKLCFKRYFGKENRSCVVIMLFEKEHIEVVTIWQTDGN